MAKRHSRRAVLGALGGAAASLAGCRGFDLPTDDPTTTPDTVRRSPNATRPESAYAAVYEDVSPSVASVQVYQDGSSGEGSAFVYDDTHLVTNEHVVAGGEDFFVRFTEGGWLEATPLASDVYSDLAVLSIDSLPTSASPLAFVEEPAPVGTEVVAIGNPFGFSGSVSAGIVSGVDRTLPAANGFSIPDAVQTDAAVNPGNSGGPLVTLDREVAAVVNSGGGDNLGFGISAALCRRVIPALIRDGEYEHAYMGVRLTSVTPRIAEANDLETAAGVYIDEVIDGAPADGALEGSTGSVSSDGVTVPTGGDVIVALDGTAVPTRQDLATHLALETRPGDRLRMELVRDGERTRDSFELGARPEP